MERILMYKRRLVLPALNLEERAAYQRYLHGAYVIGAKRGDSQIGHLKMCSLADLPKAHACKAWDMMVGPCAYQAAWVAFDTLKKRHLANTVLCCAHMMGFLWKEYAEPQMVDALESGDLMDHLTDAVSAGAEERTKQ